MTGGLSHVGVGSFVSASTASTIELGRMLGALLEPGDVLVLTGDLGAGKTQLTKGVAQAMGVTDEVTSPTFNIQVEYVGERMPLYHFDLYRLDDPDQLGDAGVYDVVGGDGPSLVEWGESFEGELGDDVLDVRMARLDADVAPGVEPPRSIELEAHGPRAETIVSALEAAC
jgi:tRNA threonylcarbamoyladenosine biosynthesis protein TsaE